MTSKLSISFEGCLYTAFWNAAYIQVETNVGVVAKA